MLGVANQDTAGVTSHRNFTIPGLPSSEQAARMIVSWWQLSSGCILGDREVAGSRC